MYEKLQELRARREADERGFTLIELLVVVVIIGILIAIAIPLYLNYQKGAHDKSAQSDLRGAVATMEQCFTDHNSSYDTPTAQTAAGDDLPFPTTGDCKGQVINVSDKVNLKLFVADSGQCWAGYTQYSSDGKTYVYDSTKGGKVDKGTAPTGAPAC